MSKFMDAVLIISLTAGMMLGIFKIADCAIYQQDKICQEGC
jgi:hypothetical protein